MWLKTIQLKNIKSFADSGEIHLSQRINLFVGPNNSGKAGILKSAYLLQGFEHNPNFLGMFLQKSVRFGTENPEVRLLLADPNKKQLRCLAKDFDIKAW